MNERELGEQEFYERTLRLASMRADYDKGDRMTTIEQLMTTKAVEIEAIGYTDVAVWCHRIPLATSAVYDWTVFGERNGVRHYMSATSWQDVVDKARALASDLAEVLLAL